MRKNKNTPPTHPKASPSPDRPAGPERLARRSFLKKTALSAIGGGTALAGLATLGALPSPVFAIPRYKKPADLPPAKGLRCVIIGGGWSGLTMAKYLKAQNPLFSVVLVEQNTMFNSTIFSNPWLVNAVTTDFTQFSYISAARNNGYLYMQATVIDVNKSRRTVYTDQGTIKYEYLVVAPGIDYDYEKLGVTDRRQAAALKQNFPAGYRNASELITLKNKIQDYVGGDFVITVPRGNYRCMSGPYERACLVADYFKKEKIDGKVIVLDQNDRPRILAKPFLKAFRGIYKDQVSYHPQTTFSGIDPFNKRLDTNHGAIDFEDASIYPPVRAARLVENIGLANRKNPQKEADIDPLYYNAKKLKYVFVTGDARPQPFSKSAYTAYSEAQYVAGVINAHFSDRDIAWQSPETVSYNMVSTIPATGIRYSTKYKPDDRGLNWQVEGTQRSGKPTEQTSRDRLDWGKRLYNDMLEA